MADTRRDDHHVAPREQRRRGGVAQPVDLLVDRRVLLDVEVLARDVRLGLVVVVVADEVLDGVGREVGPELVAELGRQRLVVGEHERRPLQPLDRGRHRHRLAGAGGAQQRHPARAGLDALDDAVDRLRLIGGGRVDGVELEGRHGPTDDSDRPGWVGRAAGEATERGCSRGADRGGGQGRVRAAVACRRRRRSSRGSRAGWSTWSAPTASTWRRSRRSRGRRSPWSLAQRAADGDRRAHPRRPRRGRRRTRSADRSCAASCCSPRSTTPT